MKIKVLLVMPDKEIQTVKIPASIKFIKAFIGEKLEKINLSEDIVLIANKDAKLEEVNRIVDDKIVFGTFLITSIKKNRITSMKKRDIRKYTNIFKLKKHQKKINRYRDECLEEYYSYQRKIKERNAKKVA